MGKCAIGDGRAGVYGMVAQQELIAASPLSEVRLVEENSPYAIMLRLTRMGSAEGKARRSGQSGSSNERTRGRLGSTVLMQWS